MHVWPTCVVIRVCVHACVCVCAHACVVHAHVPLRECVCCGGGRPTAEKARTALPIHLKSPCSLRPLNRAGQRGFQHSWQRRREAHERPQRLSPPSLPSSLERGPRPGTEGLAEPLAACQGLSAAHTIPRNGGCYVRDLENFPSRLPRAAGRCGASSRGRSPPQAPHPGAVSPVTRSSGHPHCPSPRPSPARAAGREFSGQMGSPGTRGWGPGQREQGVGGGPAWAQLEGTRVGGLDRGHPPARLVSGVRKKNGATCQGRRGRPGESLELSSFLPRGKRRICAYTSTFIPSGARAARGPCRRPGNR